MFMVWPSKGQELGGCQCPETGVKIGKATTISMAKASHSRSPLVMAVQWCPTMLPLLVGPSAKPTLVLNSAREALIIVHKLKFQIYLVTLHMVYAIIPQFKC